MTERSADYVAWRDAHRKVAASMTDEIVKRAALMGFAPKEHIDPRGGKEGDNKPATLRLLMSMRWWYALRPDRLLAEETTTTTPMFPIKSKKRDWREVDSELRKMFPLKGGNKSKGFRYAGSNELDEVGWFLGNSGERTSWLREILKPYEQRDQDTHKTHPVKNKKPNELGLYDMSGNVMELVTNRFFPHGMKYRLDRLLLRGGGFYAEENNCLTVSESRYNGIRAAEIGFRLALSADHRLPDYQGQ